mmetsp:Transcript_41941/g.100945  ORF Transcript_41941/g.100945 Transcript_41941/m.100945 type:complete len:214 (-) Transcript_41941:464-1105(-)
MISSALALTSSSACPRAACCSPAACGTSSRNFWERISPALASTSLPCSPLGDVPLVGGSSGAARDSSDIGASAGGTSSLLAIFGVLSGALICFRFSSNDLRHAADKSSSTSTRGASTSPSIRCHPCIRCHSEGCTASGSSAATWGASASPSIRCHLRIRCHSEGCTASASPAAAWGASASPSAWCVVNHSSLGSKGCSSGAVCSSSASSAAAT